MTMKIGDKFEIVGTHSTATIMQMNCKKGIIIAEVTNPLREGKGRKVYLPFTFAELENEKQFTPIK